MYSFLYRFVFIIFIICFFSLNAFAQSSIFCASPNSGCSCGYDAKTVAVCDHNYKKSTSNVYGFCVLVADAFYDQNNTYYQYTVNYDQFSEQEINNSSSINACNYTSSVTGLSSKQSCSSGLDAVSVGAGYQCMTPCDSGEVRNSVDHACTCPDVPDNEQTGVCAASDTPPDLCADALSQCETKCNGASNVDAFACQNGEVTTACQCKTIGTSEGSDSSGVSVVVQNEVSAQITNTNMSFQTADYDTSVTDLDFTDTESIQVEMDKGLNSLSDSLHQLSNDSSDVVQGSGTALNESLNSLKSYLMPEMTLTGDCALGDINFYGHNIELSMCPYIDLFVFIGNLLFFFANYRAVFITLNWIGK